MARKDGEFWDEYNIIKEIPKNDKGDVIRVATARRGNSTYVDVRTFYLDAVELELKPGKGISIPEDLADEVALTIIESSGKGDTDGEESEESEA